MVVWEQEFDYQLMYSYKSVFSFDDEYNPNYNYHIEYDFQQCNILLNQCIRIKFLNYKLTYLSYIVCKDKLPRPTNTNYDQPIF